MEKGKLIKFAASIGICLLLAVSSFIILGTVGNGPKTADALNGLDAGVPVKSETAIFGTGGDMVVSNAQAGGACNVTYAARATSGGASWDGKDESGVVKTGAQPARNSITIPIIDSGAATNWVQQSTQRISIKYSFPGITMDQIWFFLGYAEGGGNILAQGNGWNVASNTNKQGESYVTITPNYTEWLSYALAVEGKTIDKLVIAFATTGSTQRNFTVGGVVFHTSTQVPSFVTDVKDPAAELADIVNAGASNFTLNAAGGATRTVGYTGQGDRLLKAPVNDAWRPTHGTLYIDLSSNRTVASGTTNRIRVFIGDTFETSVQLPDYNNANGFIAIAASTKVRLFYDLPEGTDTLSNIFIQFDPTIQGETYTSPTSATTVTIYEISFQARFTQSGIIASNGGVTSNESTPEGQKITYRGNGWNSLKLSLTSWNSTYSVFWLDLNVDVPNVLFGIQFKYSDGTEVNARNHNNANAVFTAAGDYSLYFTNLQSTSGSGTNRVQRTLTAIEFWFEPPSGANTNPPPIDQLVTITFKAWSIKQPLKQAAPEFSAPQNVTVDYDGEAHPLPAEQPQGQDVNIVPTYATSANGTYSAANIPVNAGTYYVRYTFAGNGSFNPIASLSGSNYHGSFIINRIANPEAATASDLVIDWTKAALSFASVFEVNTAQDFSGTAVTSGAAFDEGTSYYIRLAQSTNYLASAAVEVSVPNRTAVSIDAVAEQTKAFTGEDLIPDFTPGVSGLSFVYKYRNEGSSGVYTDGLPREIGAFEVVITSVGTPVYRSGTATVTLTVIKGMHTTPTLDSFTINYETEKFIFTADYLVSKVSGDYGSANLIASGETVLFGQILYAKRIEDANGAESAEGAIVMPSKPAAPAVAVDTAGEITTVAISADWEYESSDDPDMWLSGAGEKVPLLPGTVYKFRVKLTSSSFLGLVTTLNIPSRPTTPSAAAVGTPAATSTTITVTANAAWEYRLGATGTWQGSNEFSGLNAGTQYTVYVRVKATADTFASLNRNVSVTTAAHVSVTGVTLNKNTLSLTEGGTETLVATVAPTGATNKNVTWISSNTAVAEVDSNGLITAKAAGTANITVKTADGEFTAVCALTVTAVGTPDVSVTGVTLNKNTLSLTEGGSETLTATVAPADATNKKVIWTSSDTGVAVVDANGKVTAKAAGTATITAKTEDGEFTAVCVLTVTAKPAENPDDSCSGCSGSGGAIGLGGFMLACAAVLIAKRKQF